MWKDGRTDSIEPMNGETHPPVTDGPVEFGKYITG